MEHRPSPSDPPSSISRTEHVSPQYLLIALLAFLTFMGSVKTASGQAWVSNGPGGGAIPVLAVDPTTPTTIYAGTSGSGIFKSTNAGGNWTAINNGLQSLVIEAIAVDPVTSTTLYAGTDGGLFRSTDGGGSWSFVTMMVSGIPIMETIIAIVAIDPKTPTTIYAASPYGAPGGGLFKSTDAGASWTALKQGLPTYGTSTLPWVSALVIDPLTPTTLYAAAVASGFGNVSDIFKSTDGGASWTSASTGQPGTGVSSLVIAATIPTSTLYVTLNPTTGGGLGVFKSTNGGVSWSVSLSGLVWSVAVDPAFPTTLYAGNPNGPVYKTTDGGASWTTITSPTNQFGNFLSVFAFGKNPPNPSTIYAAGGSESGGVFKSTDGGASWSTASSGLSRTSISSLAIDPKTPTTIYAGTGDGSGGGVFKSTDGGGSWTAASSGLPNSPVIGANSLVIDPSTPTTLYVAGNGIHGGGGGVFKSTDGGGSWSAINTGLSGALAINPATPTTIYVGTSGVFQSTNGGGSWTPVNTGLTVNGAIPFVNALAIDPVNPATIYAMTLASSAVVLFKSVNGGGSWTAVNTTAVTGFGSSANVLAIDPVTPTTIYYVLGCSGTACGSILYKSSDGGASWSTFKIPGNVDALVIDPTTSAILYAGLSDNGHSGSAGVSESTDGGQTWSPIDAGFAQINVQALAIDARGSNIFAGTSGGVYSTIAGTSPAQTTTTLASSPNPSAPGQSVTFTATVTSGSGTATGTAVFTYWGKLYANDGSLLGCCYPHLLGTAQLNAGVGSLSVSSLPVGSDLMTAVYQPGSIRFVSSTSAFLTQTVAQPPIATVAPTNLTFGAQDTGTTSASQPVMLNNTGNGTLTVSSIATSGDFSQTNACGSSVAATSSCTINVTFTPTAAGTRTGTLTITDNNNLVSGSRQTVSLTGTGINNPVPTITTISPSSATAGGVAFTLTVNGTGFVSNSTVNFNGNARSTSFVSATQLTAAILASDIATAGNFNVTVTNPAPGGGTSNAVSFTVNNPVPTVTSISPTSALAGGAAFTLTVNGTGFVPTSVVNFGASARVTTFVSATQLTAAILASDIAAAGDFNVTVFNPPPGGGTSNAVNFAVTGFSIAVATGGSAMATVTAGQTASYNLHVSPSNGFTGTVNLTCSGAPSLATCTPAPSNPSVNGTATLFTVNVTTSAPSIAGLLGGRPRSVPLSRSIAALLGVVMLMVLTGTTLGMRRPQRALAPVLAMIALALLSGCGGGSPSPTPIGGTPKGTYTLTVTGSSGGANRTISLTLTVN